MSVLDIAVAVMVLLGGFCTAIAFAVKFILLPWLRSNLVEPVKKTHHSVTVNGGKSDPPTLRDDISLVREDLKGLIRVSAENTTAIENLKDQFDQHLQNGND